MTLVRTTKTHQQQPSAPTTAGSNAIESSVRLIGELLAGARHQNSNKSSPNNNHNNKSNPNNNLNSTNSTSTNGMDTFGKRIFLKALTDRKQQLFGPSAAPGAEKDRLWREVFEECVREGCTGLRDVDHLRKTTWQNLQRRAKDKYERSRRGDGNAHLNEVSSEI